MATAIIKATIPGLAGFASLTMKLFAHPGTQDAAAAATGLSLTVDAVDTDTYWTTVDATNLNGVYLAKILEGTTNRASGYVKITNTGNVHVLMGTPNLAAIDGTKDFNVADLVHTTIATLASQTSFTLTAGSADDDAYNGALAIIEDATTAVQKASVAISDYTGSTKTVTLVAAAPFTVAVGDRVTVVGQNLSGTTVGLTDAALAAIWSVLVSSLTTVGSIGKFILDGFAALVTALSYLSTGTGPHHLALTFKDEDGLELEGVRVTVKLNGAVRGSDFTDVNGLVGIDVESPGTYQILATLSGHYFAGASLVVDGDETEEYELATLSEIPTQTNPDLITGYVYCYDEHEALEAGVVITGYKTESNQGDGYSGDTTPFSITSVDDPLGLASRGFLRGAKYKLRRGKGPEFGVDVPLTGDNFALDEHLGRP